ncbi:MAG: chalcone isomerase family protein [Rhodoferax sp.]|uniref:chalcone isomerase family protein n=1 Tax=Rhodoferax sp. TaxID=50421 RepID=UPI002735BC28|nr:chalcone isomerase family protein [Rhodoferax sp.]MDP2677853.1 chalcone isomerase family protein [Rhodoferax sp.]
MRAFNSVKRPLATLLLACAALAAWAQPLEVEGIKLEATSQLGAAKLQLNGAGLRTKVFFKVYVAALYTPQKATTAAQLLAQTGARRVTITMLRNVDAESFASALNDGLRDNHTEAQFAAMKPRIDALNANLKAVGEAKKGDVIHFEFAPDAGTQVTVNGQARGSVIAGEDFFTAVLRIWLGDKPVDDKLKNALIGG